MPESPNWMPIFMNNVKKTLDLRRMMVSQAYAEQLARNPGPVI
jgi:hypothetical protein